MLTKSNIFQKNIYCCSLKMITRYYLFQQLWASFITNIVKRPTIFMALSQSSCQVTMLTKSFYLQTLAIPLTTFKIKTIYYSFWQLWRSYEKTYSFYNIFSKFLSHSFTSCSWERLSKKRAKQAINLIILFFERHYQ